MLNLHLTLAELEAGLDTIRQSPPNNGRLEYIVVRPQKEERNILPECELSPQLGVHGDMWLQRGTPNPKAQVALMNSRTIALLARSKERWALAGDQLYIDLDLSDVNLQPGQRLTIGSVILEVTDKPHLGCAKFASRFGEEALNLVNSAEGRQLHLRGIFAIVVQAGKVQVGDIIVKC